MKIDKDELYMVELDSKYIKHNEIKDELGGDGGQLCFILTWWAQEITSLGILSKGKCLWRILECIREIWDTILIKCYHSSQ